MSVCGLSKYRQRLTLAAGEAPALSLKLKPGEDVLEAARTLVEDLKLAAEEGRRICTRRRNAVSFIISLT